MSSIGPNFFIVGAPKCGTTAIHSYLENHPDVFFPSEVKEPHYYNTDLPGFRWHKDYTEYLKLFDLPAAANAKIKGEASVQYLYSTDAAIRIANDAPSARILICIRNPVPFIRSYHNQMLINLDESITDLAAAWELSESLRSVAREPRMLNYKAMGAFSEQIDRYRAVFPDNQIRILGLERFVADPRTHYQALLNWLNLEDDGRDDFEKVHPASRARSRRLAKFLKSPPFWMRNIIRGTQRLVGVKSLGIAQKLANANRVEGYATKQVGEALAMEISTHYAADQSSLFKHRDLWLVPYPDDREASLENNIASA